MFDLNGAIDSHVHAGPELFTRSGDAVDFAHAARAAGMAGLLFKAHHESTVTRAQHAARAVPGIELYGGIVLNGFVGGINPLAVAAALSLGARMVWGPTLHAAHHVRRLGAGTFGLPNLEVASGLAMREGITTVDGDGKLLPQMREVIALAKAHDATVATGHLGDEEAREVATVCAEEGVRCVLTHALFLGQQAGFCEEMTGTDTYLELSASLAGPLERHLFRHHGGGMRLDQARDLIDRVGRDRVVLSSDAGQDFNPPPHMAFGAFLSQLTAVGVPATDIRHMATETPRRMLGLAGKP